MISRTRAIGVTNRRFGLIAAGQRGHVQVGRLSEPVEVVELADLSPIDLSMPSLPDDDNPELHLPVFEPSQV